MKSILTTLLCGALFTTVPSSREARFASSSRTLAATTARIVVLTFDDAVQLGFRECARDNPLAGQLWSLILR